MLGKKASFMAVVGCILVGYGLLFAVLTNSFGGLFVDVHLVVGSILLILWAIQKFFAKAVKENLTTESDDERKIKKTSAWFHLIFDIICVLVVVVGINFVVNRHEKRIDTTAEKVYSLVPETLQVLDKLRNPIRVTAMIDPNKRDEYNQAEELLKLYSQYKRELFTYEIVDPKKNPHRIKELNLKAGEHLAIEYTLGNKVAKAHATGVSEDVITNAIVKFMHGETTKIYYVFGHGEPSLESEVADGVKFLADDIGELGFNIVPISLADHNSIPDDATAVILIAPLQDIPVRETDMLRTYLENGGKMLVLSDPDSTDAVRGLVSNFGIEIGRNVIIDKQQHFQGAPDWQVVIREYGRHPITQLFAKGDLGIWLVASTVSISADAKKSAGSGDKPTYTELVRYSSASAWGETDLELLSGAKPQAMIDPKADVMPPFSLAVAYEKKESDSKITRMVVFGDSSFVRNNNLAYYANRKLILNSLNWITQSDNAIVIPQRSLRGGNQLLPYDVLDKLEAVALFFPELLLILGLAICWRRKRG